MDFIALTKLLLSSLSARACRYMYLNVPEYKDSIILSNCTPDLIADYKPELCSIYIISPHEEYLNQLEEFLNIQNTNDTLVLKTYFILNILSHYKPENVKFIFDYQTGIVSCKDISKNELIMIKSGNKKDDKSEDEDTNEDNQDSKLDTEIYTLKPLAIDSVVGSILNIPYVLDCLSNMLNTINITLDYVLDDNIPSEVIHKEDILNTEYIHSAWYKRSLGSKLMPLEKYKNDKTRFMLLVDRLDNPSIKEFIRKLHLFKDSTFDQYVFLIQENILQSLSLAIFDNIEVITMRPYAKTILLSDNCYIR